MSYEKLTENDIDILEILRMIRRRSNEARSMADYYSDRGISGDTIIAMAYRARASELDELASDIIQLYAQHIEEELKNET